MIEELFKKLSRLAFIFTLAGSMFFFAQSQWMSGLGVWVGALWIFLNSYFLFHLVQVGTQSKVRMSDRILLISILKFPVLYIAGYFILKSRVFPIGGILTGLSLFILAYIFTWIRFNVGKRSVLMPLILGTISFPFFHQAVAWCSESAHAEGGHGGGHEGGGALHLTNLVGLLSGWLPKSLGDFLVAYENVIFGSVVIMVLCLIFYFASKDAKLIPGRLQAACEGVVEWLNDFVCGILGPQGRTYTPFLGTLFLYIWTMNLIGLVPLMKSNTANSMTLKGPVALPVPTTTIALALIVFVVVQTIGIRKQGIKGYLDHMAGTPRDAFGWVMSPLMFVIHLIGEFAKPFSLTFRLFCNIMGGHILVAVFVGMGVAAMLIPFQAPFLIFEIATSTIQAFVFTLLSTVYIAMMLPHGDHSEEHAH